MADDIERVRQAALKDPTQLVRFADLLVAAGRSDEAVQACRKALTQRPDDVPLRLALGRALSAAGHLEEAQAALLDAVARQQRAAAAPPAGASPPRVPSSPTTSATVRRPAAPSFEPADAGDSGPVIADPSIEEEIVLATAVSGPAGLADTRTLDDGPTGFEDDAATSVASAEEIAKPPRRPIEPQRPLEPGRVTTLPQRNPARAAEPTRGDRVTTLPERSPMEGARGIRAPARPDPSPLPPREEPRRAPPMRQDANGALDLRATARALLGDVSADVTGHIEDVAPTPVPDEMSRAWDARRARSFVWLWVALVLLSGGIAGGYVYRARERARLLAIAVERADARAVEATADGDFAARDAYAGALRADPKARKYAAMVALAAARLAADQGEDTDAAGWAMIKRSEKEAERNKNAPVDPRAERDLRQARALLALGRGETCSPLVDAEDGDIAARCALQRGDTDAARKILADDLKADPKNARALLALASLELGAGDLDAADAAFGKVLAAYPGHPRAVIGRIMVAIERGESPKIPDEPPTVRLGLSTEAWFHLARGLEILNAPPKTDSIEAATAELDLARRGILHDGRLSLLYGRARLLQGKVAEAEQAMRIAERLNPNDADVAVLDAEVALAKGYEEKVVAALSVGAQTPRKLAVLGRAQALTGRYKEAAATLDAALAKRPGDAVSITYRAIARSHLGDAAGAQKELEKAASELSSSTAYYGLGLLAFERRDLQRAKTELEKALAGQNAEAFRARALLGRVLRELGKTSEALAELERVAREAPALLPVHAALGRLYLDVGRDREARTELRQVLDGGAPTPDDRLAYAEALVHLGAVDQAEKAIEDAVQAGVPATRVARLRLELQSWKGPKEALVAAKLLEKDRKGPGLRDNALTIATADAFRRAGDLKHASDLLREALTGGEQLRANLGLGRIQLAQGDSAGAEASFRAALDIVSKAGTMLGVDVETEARIGLARTLLARKAASEAQTLLETAVDKDPQSAEAHYFLGRAYQDKNDFDKARAQADRAVGLDDGYADAWALVGDLAKNEHLPRIDRAKEAYKKYLTLEPDGERSKSIKKSLATLK